MVSNRWLSVVSAGVLALGLAACGSDDDNNPDDGANGDGGSLSGSVLIDGSSTVAPLSEAAAELFMGENGGVQVDVATSGTGGGFEKFCNGETDISDASRPIGDDEIAICEANSVAYEQLTVANDALSVVVHPDNPVDCLTVEQLTAMWGPDSTLASWSDVPDLEADFGEPLELYGPGPDSGTFDYFTEAVNGEEGAIRTDYNNIGENDESGIVGVEGSPGGLFFVGYTYFAENQDRVKALQIDGGGGCVAPTEETAQDGSYAPLSRGLFIYVSSSALSKPEALAFVQFYIENNDAISGAVGAIAMTQEQKDEATTQVDTLVG
ncbi:MAG: phosphate ABC transporter substrate-binding protein PstS family protein [Micromonosporaceae bacterium]|nr:phosphate ABC transporter substrate-binding protein PstS family protein [Micromonosporaceae bacterium]